MGMVHGRISKLVFDMEAEKELEEELHVRNIAVGREGGRGGAINNLGVWIIESMSPPCRTAVRS